MHLLLLEILWILATIVAVTDLRARIIPNAVAWLALGLGIAWMTTGVLSWWHLAWAVGTWIAYDLQVSLKPGSMAFGDVKWAAIIMGVLGAPGLAVLLTAHLTTMVWGTITWLRHHRTVPWRTIGGMPWAPGTWIGVTGLLIFSLMR